MASRGNYWEFTYQADGWAPEEYDAAQDAALSGQTGRIRTRLIADPHNKIAKSLHRDGDRYEECDFSFRLQNGSFANCSFKKCRFNKFVCEDVKFNNCTFEDCNFAFVTFDDCAFFENCTFKRISVSAEHFKMIKTSISASKFLPAIGTNLAHLPDGVCKTYQTHRAKSSKAKIARSVFTSTKDQADLDFYFQANKELLLSSLIDRMESYRYKGKKKNSTLFFYIASLPTRIEYLLANASGWLTDWGQSIVRALIFFLVVFLVSLRSTISEKFQINGRFQKPF